MPEIRIVGSVFVVHRSTGRILLLTRTASDRYRSGLPDIPGGKVEPGEELYAGTVRELFEEAGIRVSPTELLPVYAETEYERTSKYPGVSWIDVMFVAYVDDEAVILSEEHTSYQWTPQAEIGSQLGHPPHVKAWRYMQEHGILAGDTHIRSSTKLLVRNQLGESLVLRRSETHPYWALGDDLPGGAVEPGELPQDGAVRELMEETEQNISADKLRLVYASTAAYGQDSNTRYLFVADTEPEQKVTLSYEHDQYRWAPAGEEISMDHPSWDKAVSYVAEHGL